MTHGGFRIEKSLKSLSDRHLFPPGGGIIDEGWSEVWSGTLAKYDLAIWPILVI
jgi:hypothetical protein